MKILRIREERIKRGWTQKHVGKLVGVQHTTIHAIETSRRKPSHDVLIKLENLFGKSHRELLEPTDSNKH